MFIAFYLRVHAKVIGIMLLDIIMTIWIKYLAFFDLLAYDSTISLYEFNKLHNECLDKLELIYNKYK